MKIAAALALASLAHSEVPQEVKDAIPGRSFDFGAEYIIPTPFDPRLFEHLVMAIAKSSCDSGVARTPITDWDEYK